VTEKCSFESKEGPKAMESTNRKKEVPLSEKFSLSPVEASALTGIGMTRIREAIHNGSLVAHKHGTRLLILPDDVRAWLKALPKAGNNSVSEERVDV
jgi:excisionase family DNA binding protein